MTLTKLRGLHGKYIGNARTKRLHDRAHLTERCNTDQIARRTGYDDAAATQLLKEGWRACGWCMGEANR